MDIGSNLLTAIIAVCVTIAVVISIWRLYRD